MNTQHQPYILLFSMIFLLLVGAETSVSGQVSQSARAGSLLKISQTEARKFDEYGKLPSKDENTRLDSFVSELKNGAETKGYVISYGGRRSGTKDALTMATRAKGYVVKKGKFKSSRIVTINGGYKDDPTTELWIVPSGGATPLVSPSVDPGEVVPAKVARKSKPTNSKKKKNAKRKA